VLACYKLSDYFFTYLVVVEMVKQFANEVVSCSSLLFHGDFVYIGCYDVCKWNVVTDSIVRLEGYPGLNYSVVLSLIFYVLLDRVYALDISSDGSVVIGCSNKIVLAHDTDTDTIFWRRKMLMGVWSLCIHGSVVVVPVDNSETLVMDVATGHQILTMPCAGSCISGIRVFDGLTGHVVCLVDFLTS
jgi:hypothetical protein